MLIGISGKIKSGKDTIGDIIVNDFWEKWLWRKISCSL